MKAIRKKLIVCGLIGIAFCSHIDCLSQNPVFIDVSAVSGISYINGPGSIAWTDYNQDGLVDLFVSTYTSPCHLFENQGNGQFVEITESPLVNDNHGGQGNFCYGASFVDFDNDGDQDSYIVRFRDVAGQSNELNNLMFMNIEGRFSQIFTGDAANSGGASVIPSWSDFDQDGDIDLFVTNHGSPPEFAGQNDLFKNDEGDLVQISDHVLIEKMKISYTPIWADYNNDAICDLFITQGPGHQNSLFLGKGDGEYEQENNGEIVTDIFNSYGASAGDFDNDGDTDLFLCNGGASGNRMNGLYENNGNAIFDLAVFQADGWREQDWNIGSVWLDFDNDGDLDLLVTSFSNSPDQGNRLYENRGQTGFIMHDELIFCNLSSPTYAASTADFDQDGDLDLFLSTIGGGKLYENQTHGNNWIEIYCQGSESNRDAFGAQIRIKSIINQNPIWQTRTLLSNSGYASQSENSAHFGLGTAEIIDSLVIIWPAGNTEVYTNISVNQRLKITEMETLGIADNKLDSEIHQIAAYPNPFDHELNISISQKISNPTIEIYDVYGRKLISEELSSNETTINVEQITNGIYFLRTLNNTTPQLIRLVKH